MRGSSARLPERTPKAHGIGNAAGESGRSTLDVADTAENEKPLGGPGQSRFQRFPKLRFVSLLECGTHVLWGARMDAYAVSEVTLAQDVVRSLAKGCCVWRTGALPAICSGRRRRKPAPIFCGEPGRTRNSTWTGAFPTALTSADLRFDLRSSNKRNPIVVRVVDYRLEGVPDAEPIYRLITTMLDPELAPAVELARSITSGGDRNRLRRTQNTSARRADRAAQQNAGTGTARVLRPDDGSLRNPRTDA